LVLPGLRPGLDAPLLVPLPVTQMDRDSWGITGQLGVNGYNLTTACLTIIAAACADTAGSQRLTGYAIVAEFPHDTSAYTQGLMYVGEGVLLESTGIYGKSELRSVTLTDGTVRQRTRLPQERFGEGLALHDGIVFQLTWESGIAYVYDASTLQVRDSVRYAGEGWGLTSDGTSLIMSDGSDTLRFLDPENFSVRRVLPVRFSTGGPVHKLNELEYSSGEIFANVYQSDWVVRIDPINGVVQEILDLSALLPGHDIGAGAENVLNGVAVDPSSGNLFVTGKRWPRLYELRLERRPGAARSGQ
jgi:glutamine cyclotransferase